MEKAVTNLTGKLLIAMPGIGDPRFDQTLVYMCTHSKDGAMGLIVNRPATELRLTDLLKDLGIVPTETVRDIRVHIGGPVEDARGFVLHSSDYAAEGGTLAVDGSFSMSSTTDILEEIAAGRGPQSSLFALGYAGWGPMQIEAELAANGWLVCDASRELLFGRANDLKWNAALKSIGVNPLLLSSESGHA